MTVFMLVSHAITAVVCIMLWINSTLCEVGSRPIREVFAMISATTYYNFPPITVKI